MNRLFRFSSATALFCAASTSFAGTFSSDFNTGTAPAGTTVNGSTVVEANGGVGDSGVLKLTKNINGQSGSFVIDDLDGGSPVYGFDLTAKVRVGGGTGTPADGFSINFDPTATSTTTTGEEGTAGGITFAFDIFDNGGETPPAPSIDLKVGGQVIATHKMSIADFDTGNTFVDLHATVSADGAASLAYKGNIIFTNVYFPNYQPISAGSFVIGGRTGGLNENQWFDNLSITTFTQPQVGISTQPQSLVALAGTDVTLSVTANNADTATFQWFRNGTAVAGATSATLSLPAIALTENNAKYTVKVTGANNTVTSQEATITVKDIALPSTPALSLNFNDGATPANTLLAGGATIATSGGVNGSGALQITTDVGDQAGAFVINDLSSAAPVTGVTAEFDVLLRSAGTPADGFSFSVGSDIPDDPTAAPSRGLEDGVGSGLSVAFDLYDNGGGEAPAIDILYNGQTIASKKLPVSFLLTGDSFAHVIIHVSNEGTVDVVYKGQIIHDHVFVPGFTSITGARYAFAGRTGGASADQFIDNIEITPDTTVGPLRISTQPTAQTVLLGQTATFSAGLNDTSGLTFQWFRNGTAIANATSSSFTTAATTAGDNAALYKVQVSKGGTVLTSTEVPLSVVNLTAPTSPQVSFNFEDGTIPAGTHVYGAGTSSDGTTTWVPTVVSGVLEITENVNGEAGAFVIDPLIGGAEVSALNVAFDLRLGGGTATPADGFSFNFAPDLPANATTGAEEGVGTGITLGFDIYDNGNENPPAPSIDLKYKGVVLATKHLTIPEIETGDAFKTVLLSVSPDGTVNVAWSNQVLFANVKITNYVFVSNGKFGFYARTGGLNENQWIDNVKIEVTKSTAPLRITQDIANTAVLSGQTVAFNVGVSDPNGATYQWMLNGQPINGATSATFTTPALTAANNGAKYSVRVVGPGGSVTSTEAIVSVLDPITVSNPKLSLNFDDGTVPANVTLVGSYSLPGDGALHLTDAVNSQGGSIVVTNLDTGAVSGFTLHARVLVGGGSTPPADGFSVVWGTDVPTDTAFGEDGAGNGLILSFDIYDNGNETPPAPSIDARWNGQTIGTVKLTYQQIETGDQFADLNVRVEPDGTLDVQYKGMVLFNNLQLPGFAPLTGAAFGIGARTGGLNENQWIDDLQIATTTGTATQGPQMSIAKSANGVTVSWTGTGTLQATDVLGPNANWAPVAGATSPYNAPTNGNARFFRVVQ
jgi:hypothetical protein